MRRLEDPQLLTGGGTYVGNQRHDGLLRACFVRSPVAHARVRAIGVSGAERMPGVVAVLSADDLGVQPFHGFMVLAEACARPPLATDKVRFVGEPVAIVIAESEAAALDAAEAVVVDYDELDPVADVEAAVADGAPLQFESLGTNVVAAIPGGVPDALEGASRIVRARLENQRVAVVPMEGDAIAAIPGGPGDPYRMTVYVSTQMPHGFARAVGRVLGYHRGEVRVVTPHVGGGFGAKAGIAAEHAAVIAAARHLGRPVMWVQTRSDNLVAMPHGRGQVQWIEMGFDDDAHLVGMRARVLADAGAYAGFGGALAIGPTKNMAQGVYAIPRIDYDVAVAVTNTTPMGAFRGAGRPEAAEFLERMMDISAAELGVDPVELRRRNLLGRFDDGYTTVMGTAYDNGDYPMVLERALSEAGYESLRAEQARRREAGERWLLGIGVSVYVEITAGGGGEEFASVQIHADGSATIKVGTSAHGQGHATSFAMIVSDRLGIALERIDFVQSDTEAVPRGGGTGGSRSLQVGGSAVRGAAEQVWEQARALAAASLEADPADIVVHGEGKIGVAGVPSRSLSWSDVVSLEPSGSLMAEGDFRVEGATFPFGAHVSVVEVDVETGQVRPIRHIAVDDCGRIVNPLLVTGQQHGGIAQGMAQALWEEVVFDERGNPLTANLADYGMPSAAEVPSFETFNTETPTSRNPIGAKGIGESGTIGAMPAVHNAVVDAVSHLGVRHIPMPCTAERVWRAIRSGGGVPWSEPPAVFEMPSSSGRPEAADVDI